MKIEELLGEQPPNQFFHMSRQLDAKQKAWLITQFAENIDHNILNFLCEMVVTPALQALLDVEMATRGLGADGDVDHLDAQLEDLHGTIEALNEHARELHGGLDCKRELEGR